MVFFHKYFIFKQKFESDFEKYLTCATCIFLSAKVCNQLVPLEELVRFFLKQYNRQFNQPGSVDDRAVFEISEKLCFIEFEILSSMDFDLNIEIPYKYVHNMKFYFFEYLKNQKLIIITTNFINDSFKLPLCLYFDPLLIALASLYLASIYFKVPLPDTKEGLKWYQIIDKNVQIKEVLSIAEKINNIYKYCNRAKSSTPETVKAPTGSPIIKFESARKHGILKEELFSEKESTLDFGAGQSVVIQKND